MAKYINWKKIILFIIISAGLVLITESFLMSLGIFLLLLVAGTLIDSYTHNKWFKDEMKKIMDDKINKK